MYTRHLVILILHFALITPTIWTQVDSNTLTKVEYLQNIMLYHPVAKKANLQTLLGDAELLSAKGNLDPKLSSYWFGKEFDDKQYYRQFQGKFEIPTVLGVNVVGGYENNDGVFLNPENVTDEFGLWFFGVEVDLLQGLVRNERKTALEQARVFQSLSDNERRVILNDLFFNATRAYLEWQQAYAFQDVLQENIDLAFKYYTNTTISFENGEQTAMDTLEAFIMYQDAVNTLQKNNVFLSRARQTIDNFLWYEDYPINLQEATVPEEYGAEVESPVEGTIIQTMVDSNPTIMSYVNKQQYFEIEQKLLRERYKPTLKVKYNPLLATSANSVAPNWSWSNYTWGIDFAMPLLFRKEKADVQKGQIKIQEIALDLENKRNELTNNIENSMQQQQVLQNQILLTEQNLEGYRLLLEGENAKFEFGESSVFLVNRRQEKYISERLKLVELNIKLQDEILKFLYYGNGLIN